MAAGESWTDIAQAVGSVLAVLAGFGYVEYQRRADANCAADAAGRLSRHSINRVTERIEALIDPAKPKELALRGAQATEMIDVMRALDISKLPRRFIEHFAAIRSAVYAINVRVDEILGDDDKRQIERRERLYSSGRVLTSARREMDHLIERFGTWKFHRDEFRPAALSTQMAEFLAEAAIRTQGSSSAAGDTRQRSTKRGGSKP